MNYLLDTHTFIWWATDSWKLSARVLSVLESEVGTPFISVVNVWEIQVKIARGKLDITTPLDVIVSRFQAEKIPFLPIKTERALGLKSLPDVHNDPFDRILIAQAIVENLTLLSKDSVFAQYPVRVLW
jgi:PIN domain nuclease of toxin-antitoxin system